MNKERIIIMGLLLLTMITPVMGATLIPIEYDVSMQFDYQPSTGERETLLLLPDGYRREIIWGNTSTEPSDITFKAKLLYQLDEEKWCADNSQLKEYKNITNQLVKLLGSCDGAVKSMNSTVACNGILTSTAKNYTLFLEKYNQCAKDVNTTKPFEKKYSDCEASLSTMRVAKTEKDACEAELTKAESDKTTFTLLGFIAGLAVGWYFWKRQKGSGPSEREQAGQGIERLGPLDRRLAIDEPRD